ncbi:ABC-three component system middle component 6 [Kribbella sp. CWNU-51]
MIIPTKGIAPQRALLSVGAQIASVLHEPMTVSQIWVRLQSWREENAHKAPVPFWWFALALDVLFAMDVVRFDGDLVALRRADA